MNLQSAYDECEVIVRAHDEDRYFSTLFAPREKRPLLHAIYAFNDAIARTGESVREPMLGAIRLQWWRESIGVSPGSSRSMSGVAGAIADVIAGAEIPITLAEALINAREFDIADKRFPDIPALESYFDETSGNLMRMAARVLGAGAGLDDHARAAGIAYGMAGILRAIPFQRKRGRIFVPDSVLQAHALAPAAFLESGPSVARARVVEELAGLASHHLARLKQMPPPGAGLVALLPAAMVPAYVRKLRRISFDPVRNSPDVPLYRRQLALMLAATRGRVG